MEEALRAIVLSGCGSAHALGMRQSPGGDQTALASADNQGLTSQALVGRAPNNQGLSWNTTHSQHPRVCISTGHGPDCGALNSPRPVLP